MKLFLIIFCLSLKSWAADNTLKLHYTWEVSEDKSSHRVTEIGFDNKKIKVDGEWLNSDELPKLKTIDLNDDKKPDYALIIRRGVVNHYILYLLWNEASKSYVSLGEFPELSFDKKSQCWNGFEKGNEAGAVSLKVKGQKFVKCL